MKKTFALSAFLLLCSSLLYSQDIHFSMPYSAWMNLNPAFAGSSGCSRISGGYRNQWPNISGNFVTSFASYDQYVKVLRGGVGINYTNDLAGEGALKNISVSGIYSAHIPVFENKFVLSPAVQGTYVQKRLDWSLLNWGTIPVFIPTKDMVTYADISAGVLGYNRKFNAGLVISHFTEPDDGFIGTSRLPIKYTAHCGTHIGGNIDFAKSFSFCPSVVFTSQQDFRSMLINCAAKYDKYLLGIGYRNADAIIASVGFNSKTIRLNYSYDITVSELGIVTGGSHEFSLSFFFNRKAIPVGFIPFSSSAF